MKNQPSNLANNRIIDNTILNKQDGYLKNIENSKKNNKVITFEAAKSYIINLFINDVLSLSLKNENQFLHIKYEEIKQALPSVSNFLKISLNDLNKNLFEKPVIKKNDIIYKNNFENSDLLETRLSFSTNEIMIMPNYGNKFLEFFVGHFRYVFF